MPMLVHALLAFWVLASLITWAIYLIVRDALSLHCTIYKQHLGYCHCVLSHRMAFGRYAPSSSCEHCGGNGLSGRPDWVKWTEGE